MDKRTATHPDAVIPATAQLLEKARQAAPLAPAATQPADQHAVAVYLARLAPGSRRAMRQALGVVAELLSSGRADVETLPWSALRYQHTQGVRAALAERYSPATANKALSALRGVLHEAFRLAWERSCPGGI